MENITTSNWKAWISKNETESEDLTLHVTGDVDTHSNAFASLKKEVPEGFNPMILLLELKVENGTVPAKNPQKVHHAEAIGKRNPYTSIQILLKGKVIEEIKEIEVRESLEAEEK